MPLTDLTPGEMFVVYDPATGVIEHSHLYPYLAADVQYDIDAGKSVSQVQAVDVRSYYVTGGAITARPAMAPVWQDGKASVACDSVDACVLTNIPQGSAIRLDGATQTLDSGTSYTFTASTPGTFQITIERFPYFVWYGSYTAVVPA